ncbi:unnamed protein product, partial [Cuscuta campestris]
TWMELPQLSRSSWSWLVLEGVVYCRLPKLFLTLSVGAFGGAWVISANKCILWLIWLFLGFVCAGSLFSLDLAYLRLASELKPRAIVDEGLWDNLVNLRLVFMGTLAKYLGGTLTIDLGRGLYGRLCVSRVTLESAKKTKKKLPRSPKKKRTGDDVMETPSLNTDIAMELPEKEKAPTASSTSEKSPPHAEDVPDTGAQVGITSAQETPQVFDKMPTPDMVAAKPVTFADLFKGNRDPDQGMILKQYDVGEGVLYIPDSIIKPIEELWGFCLVGCFTGRFPGLKAVDAIVKSWNVPCRYIPHCKGWVILKFENDIDRMDVLGRERDKAYGKELRLKIPSHGFMFDFAEFTTLPVWVQLHNVPLQLWSKEGIGMLASKVGKPLRTELVTKQQGKGGFCRVLVEVDFSKQPVTHFEVACMGKTYTQLVVFEEDPKYCFHCKTWNHCPFYCKELELGKKKEMAGLETTHKVDLDKPKETKITPGKAGARDSVPPGNNPHVEPVGGLIPSSSYNKEKAKESIPKQEAWLLTGAYYMTDLQGFKSSNCLEDVPSTGNFFTWHKGNKLAKLDRVLANQSWGDIGLAPTCEFLDFNFLSDHCPTLFQCGASLGNRCTSYFHSIVKKNRRKNTVGFLVREDGSKTTSMNEVASIFVDYFTTLFGTTSSVEPIELESLIAGTRVPSSAQSTLLASVTPEEVREAVFDIGAFVPGRSLVDNFLLAQHLIRDYAVKRSTPSSLIKLDITKAYDTVSWSFLQDVMHGLGFPPRFVSLIMECVSSASSSIMVNGDSHGFFPSQRGLRQGDPMAPTLFLFCIEYFSRLLNKRAKVGGFNYHKDCAALGITHLAFADDLMLFSRGDSHSVQVLMDALDHFSRVSGLTLNPTKSNIFLSGKYTDVSQNILDLAPFPRGQLPVRYLGLPLASQRISESDFAPLFKTVDGFLSKWSTLKLSYAGRLELIRAVVQGVQSFWLLAFPVQKYVLDRIISMCRDFLWGSKLAKVAWVDICKPREEGGLGLKDANTWNNALLCKLLWNLAAKNDTLWVKWVHNVYIQGENLWQWQPMKRHSDFFKRLAYVRDLFVQKLGDLHPSMEEAMNPFLLGRRRLPTKTNLEFLGLPMDCTFCGHGLEDVDHLFFSYQFSKEVWDSIKTWLAQSAKKTKKKLPRSPKKKGTGDDVMEIPSLNTDIAMELPEKEKAPTASSTSETSPPHVEDDPDTGAQVGITYAQETAQVFDKMPEPDMVAAKPVTFADLFKGNRDPDQGMILKQYDVGEGVLHIPDSIIKPVEELWGFCLVGCFTGRFPGLKAVDAIVKSWNVPCRIIPHCKGWVILKFENDSDRMDVLGRERDKAYGKELRLKITSHEGIGMLASKAGRPLRSDLVTKQQGKGGFCRVLVEVDFSKQPATHFEVACMGKTYTQLVVFEEDPKYCFHCKTWNHCPFYCKELGKKKEMAGLETTHKVDLDKPKETKITPGKAGARDSVPPGNNPHVEPVGGLIPSSSYNNLFRFLRGLSRSSKQKFLCKYLLELGVHFACLLETKSTGAKLENFVITKLPGWRFATNFEVLPRSFHCLTTQKEFVLSFIYGMYTVTKRRELWHDLSSLAQNISIPWALLGDFNCVLASNERVNCMSQGAYYMSDLQGFMSSNCLEDVPSTGNFFTWHKGNKLAKLDRVLANQSWGDIGLAPTCEFLDFNFLYDHCPTLFQCGAPFCNRFRPFRFFNMWLKHESFNGLVSQSWEAGVVGSKQFSFCSKLKRLKPPLKSLKKQAFGHISRRAMEARDEYGLVMKQVVVDPNNQTLLDDADIIRKRANFLLDAELAFYQQKAKCDFLMNSDRCTSYFHSIVKKNRRKNTVGFLVREDGSKTTSKNEVASIFVDYFTTLFGTTSLVEPFELEILTAGTRVPSSAQSTLLASVTPEEVREAVFDIGNDKAPGPDGYTAAFFKDQWATMGRSLVDNFLLAQHLIRDYAVKRSTPSCLIKLDITKAYDTVSWSFLQDVMHGLGFPPKFVSLIMECVSSASSSIMVNGDSHGFFPSQRGLRKGDPMAPTLFLFCIEYFSRLLNKRAKEGGFNYHKVCATLGITHLAFADDLMLFSRGDFHFVQLLMDVLDHFSRVSCLTLNPTKSNIFLAGKYRDVSQNILDLASFPHGQLPVRYLGLPLASQRISESDFAPLFKTVDGFLSKWSTLKLSYARRLELIRAVVQGVQSFLHQAFPVQKYVLDRITSMCREFLWGSKLAKVAWVDICKPKVEGGLGLKDANTWNNALLCKLLWNLEAKMDALWVKWVHNVYIQGENLWQWQPKKRHSVFFKRLAYVRDLLVQKLGDHYPSMEEAMNPFCLADVDHLFFSCQFPKEVWDNVKTWLRMEGHLSTLTRAIRWLKAFRRGDGILKKARRIAFACTIFHLWKLRNVAHFEREPLSIQVVTSKIKINHALVVLIPKIRENLSAKDYRPIACSNVVYKIITKILSNRMAGLLPSLINPAQAAFIKGRSIVDNILLVQHLVRGYARKRSPPCCMLKLDISKAYGTISWDFLRNTLQRIGFPPTFVNWVMECVTTASFSLSINGGLHGFIKCKRGIRHGDPVAPTLFLFCMEYLSRLIRRMLYGNRFTFHNRKEDILALVAFPQGKLPVRYLGLPLTSQRASERDSAPLVNKVDEHIRKWNAKTLSAAGRLELIRSVIQGIEGFWFQAFPIHKSVLDRITSLCRTFLWGSKFCTVAWEDICKPKDEGGLGLNQPIIWNQALLSKNLWKIAFNKETLWVQWVHSVYLDGNDFWTWSPRKKDSHFFKKLIEIRDLLLLKCGDRWELENQLCDLGEISATKEEETGQHLFFSCETSTLIWNAVRSWLEIAPALSTLDRALTWLRRLRNNHCSRRKMTRLAILSTAYHIWRLRNGVYFDNQAINIDAIVCKIKVGVSSLWCWVGWGPIGFVDWWGCEETNQPLLTPSGGNMDSVTVLANAIKEFSQVSGLHVNPLKSNIYLAGEIKDNKHDLLSLVSFPEGKLPVQYLGLPLTSQRASERDFAPLIAKVDENIRKWNTRSLSAAGRLELVRSVIQGIEGFWFQAFPIHKTVLDRITSLWRTFLWGSKFCKVAWADSCKLKDEGGWGLRDSMIWNQALLAKSLWNIASKKDTLWIQWVHSVYLEGSNFWTWIPSKKDSHFLKKIVDVRDSLLQKCGDRFMIEDNLCDMGDMKAAKVYELLRSKASMRPWMKVIWQPYIPPRYSFTVWLTLRGRLPTKMNLHFIPMDNRRCEFCHTEEETTQHLFFLCEITSLIWGTIKNWLKIAPALSTLERAITWARRQRHNHCAKRKMWRLAILSTVYNIWRRSNLGPPLGAGTSSKNRNPSLWIPKLWTGSWGLFGTLDMVSL